MIPPDHVLRQGELVYAWRPEIPGFEIAVVTARKKRRCHLVRFADGTVAGQHRNALRLVSALECLALQVPRG